MALSIFTRLSKNGGATLNKTTKRIKSAVLALSFISVQLLSPAAALATDSPTPVANPSLSQACGLDIALVMDRSNSIGSSDMSAMKSALTSFTSALNGTPNQFSVTRFGTTASVVSGFTGDVATTNAAINSVTTGGGGTNWEAGLLAAASTFDPRADKPNLVIFASDGDPTFHNGGGNGSSTSQADIDAAVVQANAIKNSGTRMLALGIGGPTVSRLQAISGPNVNTGNVLTSDVITTNFSELATELAEFALQTCGGTITVNKMIDQDGNPNTVNDQTPGVNWGFDVNGVPSNPSPVSTDINGQTPAVAVGAGNYSINETPQAAYALVAASCTGATGNGSKQGNAITNVQVGSSDIVACTFINTPKPTLKLKKKVTNNNGGTAQISDFQAKIDGNNVAWNTAVTLEPGQHTASETNLPGYSPDGWGGDCANDGTVNLSYGQTAVCEIENLDVAATLKVTKKVVNQYGTPASADSFKLYVNGNQVTNGANYSYDAGAYIVSEDGLFGYELTSVDGDCSQEQSQISVLLGLADEKSCTLTNTAVQPKLIVKKHVVNNNSGTKQASDFTMTVSGNSQVVPNFPGDELGTMIGLNEGSYSVDELATEGYNKHLSEDCSGTISVGEVKTCVITNDDIAIPAINVEKYGPATALEGQSVTYTFHVTNVGNTDLSGVTVQDTIAGSATYASGDDGDGILENGEVWIYTADYTIPSPQEANVTNTVTACANEYVNVPKIKAVVQPDTCDDDSHELDVLHPSLKVEKTGPESAEAGDNVTYYFTVTNTGDVALSVSKIEDNIAGNGVYVSGDSNLNSLLDLNETWLYQASYDIPKHQTEDVVNTVEVCAVVGSPQIAANNVLQDGLVARQAIVLPLAQQYCDDDSHTLVVEQPAVEEEAVLAPSGLPKGGLMLLALFNIALATIGLLGYRHLIHSKQQ